MNENSRVMSIKIFFENANFAKSKNPNVYRQTFFFLSLIVLIKIYQFISNFSKSYFIGKEY